MARRRLDGLCFNCPEKFSRDHAKQCTMRGIYFLEMDTDDAASEQDSEEDMSISMHALAGIRMGKTLNLAASIGDTNLMALIDSGYTHCFLAESTALRIGLVPEPRPGLTVGVANGECVPATGVCKAVPITIGAETFHVDVYIILLDGYELVLGCDWLRTLGPIMWDFDRRSMAFWRDGHRVKWLGLDAPPVPHLAITMAQDLLRLLLDEFADLFATPTGLPPQRAFDHRIHLLLSTPPVVVRPYWYPQLLKDEIETRCKAMLEQSIIRASTSAFSSPVLLVRKRDGTWRFCVDYIALNSKAIRDKFLIPIVDELLDELKGAIFFTKLDLRSGYH